MPARRFSCDGLRPPDEGDDASRLPLGTALSSSSRYATFVSFNLFNFLETKQILMNPFYVPRTTMTFLLRTSICLTSRSVGITILGLEVTDHLLDIHT
jgi:hypothetical protein